MSEIDDGIDDAIDQTIEESEEGKAGKETVRLSSGVVVRTKPIPPLLISNFVAKAEPPKIPEIWDEDRERSIPNPNHPDYLEALERYRFLLGAKVLDLLIMAGTSIEEVPDEVSSIEDTEWEAIYALLNEDPIPSSGPRRYLAWMQTVAILTTEDIELVRGLSMQGSTLTEEDVAAATKGFRSLQVREADS
jgi:hypothetical protein